ncbi:MAG: hypothetical protein WCS92_04945 [Candidatus Babeliales bacterium]|jgi:hypothetical protein
MAVKELSKPVKTAHAVIEKEIEQFISKGGGLSNNASEIEDDHRLTLRIPKKLLAKIDIKRKSRIGSISRNLWILETIEKATSKI